MGVPDDGDELYEVIADVFGGADVSVVHVCVYDGGDSPWAIVDVEPSERVACTCGRDLLDAGAVITGCESGVDDEGATVDRLWVDPLPVGELPIDVADDDWLDQPLSRPEGDENPRIE